jgi:hypothetical protein
VCGHPLALREIVGGAEVRHDQVCCPACGATERLSKTRLGMEGVLVTDRAGTSASELVVTTQRERVDIAEAIRCHRFLERLRAGAVPEARLRALAGERHAIVSSDRRSFAQPAARFPSGVCRGVLPRAGRGRGGGAG